MKALMLDSKDNVAVVLARLQAGDEVAVVLGREDVQVLQAKSAVPFCHKIALRDIAAGEPVLKYGETIGRASRSIGRGEHVHVQNVKSIRGSAGSV